MRLANLSKYQVSVLAVVFTGIVCSSCTESNLRPISNSESNAAVTNTARPESVIAHGPPNQPQPQANAAKWTPGGDAIDTKELDAAVMKAEKDAAGRNSDAASKKALGDAFFNRAVALTQARQYAAAIGDYRRALKHDPANTEAKTWIETINGIYAGMNKQPPREGEEPPALPFTVAPK